MEVRIGDLKPNPFRNLEKYPLDQKKIKALRGSIERNDFWDNVVVRKNGNGIELAYGHHRIEAVKEVFGKNKKVNVILKNLTDKQMLKIMADDNDDVYRISPLFVCETLEAALQVLNIKRETAIRTRGNSDTAAKIAELLDWPLHRVRDGFTQLNDINQNNVSREALEKFPNLKAARAFTAVVKQQKIPLDKQLIIAEKLAEQKTITRDAVLDFVNDKTKQRERDARPRWNFDNFLNTAITQAGHLADSLIYITKEKQLLDDPQFKELAESFRHVCGMVFKRIHNLYKGGKNEKTQAKKLLE